MTITSTYRRLFQEKSQKIKYEIAHMIMLAAQVVSEVDAFTKTTGPQHGLSSITSPFHRDLLGEQERKARPVLGHTFTGISQCVHRSHVMIRLPTDRAYAERCGPMACPLIAYDISVGWTFQAGRFLDDLSRYRSQRAPDSVSCCLDSAGNLARN